MARHLRQPRGRDRPLRGRRQHSRRRGPGVLLMDIALVGMIALALAFDYINGFHDAANSIATVVSTRVLSPRAAVIWAAVFNFAAFKLFEPKVAGSIAKGVSPDVV